MNKIQKVRNEIIDKIISQANGSWKDIAEESFDAAIELELPVKFAKFLKWECDDVNIVRWKGIGFMDTKKNIV